MKEVIGNLLDETLDFLGDFKMNLLTFLIGGSIAGYLTSIKEAIQTYIFSDFTFGKFFFTMLLCDMLAKMFFLYKTQGIRSISISEAFKGLFTKVCMYGIAFVAIHGIANFSVNEVKNGFFNTVPVYFFSGCMALELKSVLKHLGFDISKIIDGLMDTVKEFKGSKSNNENDTDNR